MMLLTKSRQLQQTGGASESLISDSVEAADAFISQWISPHVQDSSSSSCSLYSLFSTENRAEGRRFLDVLNKLQHSLSGNPDSTRGHELMRKAMKHLEKELYRVLKSNRRFLDPESVSNWSESGANADVITDLKMIANCMISSGYEKECVKIYKKFRTKTIVDALNNFGFEDLTSTQMQKLEWETLEKKKKKWLRIANFAIKTFFNGERILCDNIFSSSSTTVSESTFTYITLPSALYLFIFPITVAKCKKTTEKIFTTLDVYQTILHLQTKINQIFNYESTSSVRQQATESLEKLGDSVNAMMTEFQSSITKESSKAPILGGGVHQLTRYVMNFIVFLADYSDSLTTILKESSLPLPEDYYNGNMNDEVMSGSPMSARLAWLILVLLCKIDAKSRLYNDSALSYLFLANNLQYVVVKVGTSILRVVIGDDWVKNHEGKVSQYLEKYEKMAWGDCVTSLASECTEEGLRRFKDVFEEAVKKHRTWVVPDPKMREEIKLSISGKLVPGFKKYPVGSFEKVKFTHEDLSKCISELYTCLGRTVSL